MTISIISLSADPARLAAHARLFGRSGVDVLQAIDLHGALVLARLTPPDLLVADADCLRTAPAEQLQELARTLRPLGTRLLALALDAEAQPARRLRSAGVDLACEPGSASPQELLHAVDECLGELGPLLPRRREADAFKQLVEAQREAVLVLATGGSILFTNEAAQRLFGRSAQELAGMTLTLPAADRSATEIEIASAAGVVTAAEMYLTEISWQDRPAFLATLRDVTEGRQQARLLREQAELLEKAQNVARMGIWRMDLVRDSLYWSPMTRELFGFAPEELPSSFAEFRSLIIEEDLPAFDAAHGLITPQTPSLEVEYRIRRRDGAARQMLERGRALFDESGRATARIGIVLDVTEQRRKENQLEIALGQLRIASRLAKTGAWVFHAPENSISFSEEVFKMYGLSPGHRLEFADILARHPEPHRSRLREAIDACITRDKTLQLETLVTRGDGGLIPVRLIGEAIRDQEGKLLRLQGAMQDISQLKAAERAGEQASQRLMAVVESMADGLLTVDENWQITYANSRAGTLLGIPDAELPGTPLHAIAPRGRDSEFFRRARQAVVTDTAVLFEDRSFESVESLEVKAEASPDGLSLFLRDRSEQKALEQQLAQLQRLEALGQLTGGVAHDFNNLLTVILGSAELIKARVTDSELRELVETIRATAERGARLTQHLLAFARKQVLAPTVTNVNELLRDMRGLLQRSLGETMSVELLPGPGLWQTLIDPAQLENCILNLAINARDAMGHSGTLSIETANIRVPGPPGAEAPPAQEIGPGDYVLITVNDMGTGIAADNLAHIFEPFFSTKDSEKGTGLGLAMVYGFVHQSEGHITLDSRPGEGTTFRIYLPRTLTVPEIAREPRAATSVPATKRRILVVEDNEGVRRYLTRQLQSLGFDTVDAACGGDALRFLQDSEAIDLLFTDILMPGMDGWELARQARSLRPGLQVLFASGNPGIDGVQRAVAEHDGVFLQKPFDRDRLLQALQSALERE